MAKMSCFSILLTGRRQKRVVGDADKGAGIGNESPRVKPVAVESTAALPPLAAAVVDKCGDKIVADVLIVVAHKGGETSPVKRDSCLSDDFEFEFHPHPNKLVGSDVHGADKHATGTVPDSAVIASAGEEAAVAEVEVDPSAKLKRSCSNIETKRPGPRDAPGMRVRSRSYGDLPGDLFMVTTPRRAHEASPDASVKTSRTADRVMLKRRSSSQVLPSRSRKLWWRLFLWSHRNLHRSWSARPSDAGTPGGGYTSDTLEEPADRKNKKAMVEESPPQPPSQNQWVAFCADHSLSDRVSEWVSSIDNSECLRIAEEEDDVGGDQSMDLADCVARPRPIEAGETSGKGGHGKLAKRCAAADDVAQANSIVQSLNGFSSVAHISGMGLKVVPMIAPFSNLRAVNLSGNFIGPALAGSVAEQDRKRRGAPGADEAARAQPQLQPDLAHRPRAVELHGDQGAVPGGEQDRRRGGPAPAAEAGGAGPGLQQAHHRQGAGPAGGQLPLPPGAQPGGQPRAGQRRRRRAAQGRHRPPPAARIPQQAAPQATGGGHRQRRARGTRRRRNVGPQAGCVAAAHPEPRIVVVVQEQVQRQAAPRLERHGKEVNK